MAHYWNQSSVLMNFVIKSLEELKGRRQNPISALGIAGEGEAEEEREREREMLWL